MSEKARSHAKDSAAERKPRKLKLVDVREGWHRTPELPFAFQEPENIITPFSVWKWRQDLNRNLPTSHVLKGVAKQYDGFLLQKEAEEIYHRLRFLSRTNTQAGLNAIAQDINVNFDPSQTLIHIENGSGRLMYTMIQDQLDRFGTSVWRREEEVLRSKGEFQGSNPDVAKKIIYIDDWVLSGDQIVNNASPFLSPNRLFTYHLVMSDRGKYIFDKSSIDGKAVFRITGDHDPTKIAASFPIYGFHKIPDFFTHLYADQSRDHVPEWTISPEVNGERVGGHSRLIEY